MLERERERERVSGAYSFASIIELHCYLLLNLTFLSLNLHWLLNRNVSFPLYQSIYPHPESDRKMLDGLLGRSGFYSKCKSLIKQTRTRIDVVRRKRNATQKFLRKDVADLLANGLESNAYGRTEGLIEELILSSCYEFIDHVCEIILKHLPVLQKIRECPEDCREAIASLMFAAARFSDLPELRELRDLFQERYGSSLEYYVNQKLVENITPKPPSMEKKVQLMQEIAIEFSIWWDSQGFEERMSNSSATEKNKQQSTVTLHAAKNKVLTLEETVQKTVKDEVLAKKKSEATSQNKDTEALDRHHIEMRKEEGAFIRRDDLNHHISRGPELVTDRYKPTSYREETIQKREEHGISFRSRQPRSEADPLPVNKGINSPPALIHEPTRKREDLVDGPKSNFRSNAIPPYVKPRKSKHKIDDPQDTLTFNPGSNSNRSEKGQAKPDNPNPQEGKIVNSHGNVDGPVRFTEIYYKDAARRSHRRKHSRSTSVGQEEERVVRRVSTSRRKHESRKGLQILCDDDHYKRDDEEERVIDKLLLHYSKKPSSSESGKPKRKTKNGEINGPPPLDDEEHSTPTTSRSFSLPSRHHAPEPEPQRKVFARAASFQQDSTPAKHVHPKLPDYDDLAARFAALRASKD